MRTTHSTKSVVLARAKMFQISRFEEGMFPGVWFKVGIKGGMDRMGTSNAKGADRESRRQRYVNQE
jgi:hypothetical protein